MACWQRCFVVACLAACLLAGNAIATAAWDFTDLPTAQAEAARTQRLIIVHFWAPWCGPCKAMEQEVLSRPEIMAPLASRLVQVKLNFDEHRALAQQFGVTVLPTELILSADGRLLDKLVGRATPENYLPRLHASLTRLGRPQSPSQPIHTVANPGAGAPPNRMTTEPARFVAAPDARPIEGQTPSDFPYTPDGVRPAAAPRQIARGPAAAGRQVAHLATSGTPIGHENCNGNCPTHAAPGQAPNRLVSAQMPVTSPSALEGYCPVTLCDSGRWMPGQPSLHSEHEGATFQFATPEARQAFMANPFRYTPVANGQDIVLAQDERQAVQGTRRFGVFCAGRIYLFASADTRARFEADPRPYLQPSAPGPGSSTP